MTVDVRELERLIRAFLATELGIEHPTIDADTPLFSAGLIDSVGLVRLATFIERKTGIRIPDRDINADKFDSIGKILSYVSTRAIG